MTKNNGANRMIIVILIMALVFIVVLMELLNAHPQFNVGHTQIYWAGLRHMSFGSHSETLSAFGATLSDGGSGYYVGPVRFTTLP